MVAHACNLSTQKREGDFQMFEASLHCTVRLSWCDFCCTDKQHNQKKKIREDRDVFILKFTFITGGMQNWSRSQGGAQLAACLPYTPRLAFLYSSGPPAGGGMAQCLSPPTQVISQEKAPQNCLWASDEGSSSAKIPSSQMTLAGVE